MVLDGRDADRKGARRSVESGDIRQLDSILIASPVATQFLTTWTDAALIHVALKVSCNRHGIAMETSDLFPVVMWKTRLGHSGSAEFLQTIKKLCFDGFFFFPPEKSPFGFF